MLTLPPSIIDLIVQSVATAAWNRPELTHLREPIEATLIGNHFRVLTEKAFQTFAANITDDLPQFFDEGFIEMAAVQQHLADYIIKGQEVDIDELAEQYAKRHLKPSDAPQIRDALTGYLRQLRETFATDPTYGPILLARDMQSMTAALNNLRGEMHGRFDDIIIRLDKLLQEPEIKALVERKTGKHIFLSYSRQDLTLVLKIRQALEDAGHTVWQDTSTIKGGEEWINAIEDGIKRAYAVVTVVSKAANDSRWVRVEFLEVLRRKKPVVPIKIDDCEIPMMMLDLNVIHGHPDLEKGIDGLLKTLPRSDEKPGLGPPSDTRQLEIDYLNRILLEHSVWQTVYTPMAGVGEMRVETEDTDEIEIVVTPTPITSVFDLFIDEHLKPEARELQTEKRDYIDILPAVEEMRQLIVLGDPGSGKTTTLWRIAADYAEKAKHNERKPLPVFVRLGEIKAGQTLEVQIKAQLGSLSDCYDTLLVDKHLAFLLDGLNELPSANRATHVEQIKTLVEHCQQMDMTAVVTCRELDYTSTIDLGIPERVVITPLDPLRIRQFVNAYITKPVGKGNELFWELAGETAQEYWSRFLKETKLNENIREKTFWLAQTLPNDVEWGWRNWIWERWLKQRQHPRSMLTLARNPYILFMVTQVFTRTKHLPPNRGVLFGTFVDFLLTKREQLDKTTAEGLKNRLANLAYAMQAEGEGTSFDQVEVLKHLQDEQSLYQAKSANILSGSDMVRFSHQLLQEYFAAMRLDREMQSGTPATEFWPADSWWQPQGWEETTILLVGLYSDDTTPVLTWLCDANPGLAARCVLESGAHTPDKTLSTLQESWLPRLTNVQTNPQTEARVVVGRALCLLKLDKRPGVGLREDGLPDIAWCVIPPGEYPIGGDAPLYQQLKAQTFTVQQEYWMAKYPVTYAQFQAFLDDPMGFANDTWWEGLTEKYQKQPMEEQHFLYDNHPRDSVSWYQAVAFCRWLDAHYHEKELLPEEWEIRLPMEQEWEAAARGKDERKYPYGNGFDSAKSNTRETGIGQTSTVGIFPSGASPYGVQDMAGNVWEWCLNEYDNPKNVAVSGAERRVLRGGSWDYYLGASQAALHVISDPYYKNSGYYGGFRLVAAPQAFGDRVL